MASIRARTSTAGVTTWAVLYRHGKRQTSRTFVSQKAAEDFKALVDHLAEHRAAGHDVPDGIEVDLWEDDHDNWVDYARCDVEGCDERVTCGFPTPDGYRSMCSPHYRETDDWRARVEQARRG